MQGQALSTDFTRSFDGQDWAVAFVEHVAQRPSIATDVDTMRGWFANALMRGHDEHALRQGAAHVLGMLADRVHEANRRWWLDPATGQPVERNVGEMLMLAVSELAEAMEGHRKNLQDDKLPHRPMLEVEIVDCLIRLLDLGAGLKLDLGGAFEEKMDFNARRHDHTNEARLAPGGKKY